ncbi:MAG: tRNA (adenosine(37)-N6)-dimethylallyltransferase MiaA [Candidatus Saccharimonadales bacterium]
MAATASQPELLVIVGETASGKSALAHRIAKEFNGEVIAADSWTVYRGFDIGTSKPSQAEQTEVKYHLLDVVEAPEGFNAPKFKELAEAAITDIQNRGKLPVLAGGTGLYIDSVLYDFGFLPDVSAEERAELNSLSIEQLIQRAEELQIDLSGIDTCNKRRIIRAIEAKGEKPTKKEIKPSTLIIGLKLDNEELRGRIEKRTEEMLQNGLEAEVKELSGRFGWGIEPMKGIGYREWREYFEGTQTLEQTKQRIISSTVSLAKRQRTWFKRNQNIQWFSSTRAAYQALSKLLSN